MLETEGCRFGLVTDDVGDTVEIVVKPLSATLKQLCVFAGATILGDGSVALIIDPAGVVKHLGLAPASAGGGVRLDSGAATTTGTARDELLVVTVGSTRLALPVGRIARIEEIPSHRLQRVASGLVTRQGDHVIRLDELGDLLGRPHRERSSGGEVDVVVFRTATEPLALVVDEVADIVRADRPIARSTAAPGTVGTTVIDGEIVDIVDIDHVYALLGAEEDGR